MNKEATYGWIITPIMVFVVIVLLMAVRFLMDSWFELKWRIPKEVPLSTVPVQGTKNFTATVRIKYVDGNLKEVVLVPRTTIEEK